MAKKRQRGFSKLVAVHRRFDTLALLRDVAAAQGRVKGLLGEDAYASIKATDDDGEYMDPHERLNYWQRLEDLARVAANGGDPLVATVYAVEAGRMGAEEAIARLRGLMLLQLAGWAINEEEVEDD